jgi:hypothetical protein
MSIEKEPRSKIQDPNKEEEKKEKRNWRIVSLPR